MTKELELIKRMNYFLKYTYLYTLHIISLIIILILCSIAIIACVFYFRNLILTLLLIFIAIIFNLYNIIILFIMKKANTRNIYYVNKSLEIYAMTYNGQILMLVNYLIYPIICGILAFIPFVKWFNVILSPLSPFIYFAFDIYFRVKYHKQAQIDYYNFNGFKYEIKDNLLFIYQYINSCDTLITTQEIK